MKNAKIVKDLLVYLNGKFPPDVIKSQNVWVGGIHHPIYILQQPNKFSAFFDKEKKCWEVVCSDYFVFHFNDEFTKEKSDFEEIFSGLNINVIFTYQYIVYVNIMKNKFKPYIYLK